MYCPNCGNKHSDHANFCSSCGNPNISGNTSKKRVPEDLKESNQNKYSKYWYNKGVEFSESNEYQKALDAYNQALENDDKDPDTWNNKSYVLTKLGRYEEAINAGNIGVNLAPNDHVIWETLRDAYLANNNPEKAAECVKKISSLPTELSGNNISSINYSKGFGILSVLIILVLLIVFIWGRWTSVTQNASSLLHDMIFLILLGGILFEGWKAVKQ